MKKIFLPLVALCGLVAGLTLTSCGGGGGGDSLSGKTYSFSRQGFGEMQIVFGAKYNDKDINEAPESSGLYDADVFFKGGPDDTCKVQLSKVGDTVVISLYGADTTLLEDNSVLGFIGATLAANAIGDQPIANYVFDIELKDGLPQQIRGQAEGKVALRELDIDDDVENDDELEAQAEEVIEEAANTVPVIVTRES